MMGCKFNLNLGGLNFPEKEFELILPSDQKIGIGVTGGSDSTILVYVIARLLRDINSLDSLELVHIWKDSIEERHVSKNVDLVLNWINCTLNLKLKKVSFSNLFPFENSLSKNKDKIVSQFGLDLIITGCTKNPPDEVLQGNIIHRPIANGNPYYTDGVYSPLINFDKRYVIDLYKKLNVLDLLMLTQSCNATGLLSCGICGHCLERTWAFQQNRLIS